MRPRTRRCGCRSGLPRQHRPRCRGLMVLEIGNLGELARTISASGHANLSCRRNDSGQLFEDGIRDDHVACPFLRDCRAIRRGSCLRSSGRKSYVGVERDVNDVNVRRSKRTAGIFCLYAFRRQAAFPCVALDRTGRVCRFRLGRGAPLTASWTSSSGPISSGAQRLLLPSRRDAGEACDEFRRHRTILRRTQKISPAAIARDCDRQLCQRSITSVREDGELAVIADGEAGNRSNPDRWRCRDRGPGAGSSGCWNRRRAPATS